MIRSYLKIALRSILKYKGYSAINLVGLALGLASGILILVFVLDELSFDQFHAKGDRIYRVCTDMTDVNSGSTTGGIEANGWPIGRLLEKEFPEVEKVVYIRNGSNLQVNHEGKRLDERIFYAGREFFSIFDFPLVSGNPEAALLKPYSIVLTETTARKYFGESEAFGKTLTLADTLLFEVTGVMKDIPDQSHMQFGMLISFATYEVLNPSFDYGDGWGNLNVRNYVLLKEGVDPHALFAKAGNLYMDHVRDEMKQWGMFMYVKFEPLKEIYLHTRRGNGMGPLGSMERVYIVSGIAVFVILLACINFVNLATARSAQRAKEVGLRKVVGSTRQSLIKQFLGESFLLTAFSLVLALVLLGLSLPFFNQLLAKTYDLRVLVNPWVVTGIVVLVGLVTLLSGYYPALVISAMRPADVLKGDLKTGHKGIQLRRVLVVFQFIISASLIVCTFAVLGQLDFMINRDLGFSGHQVIVLDADRVTDRGGVGSAPGAAFKNELRSLASVEQVTFTNAVPGRPGWVGQWAFATDRPDQGSIGMEYMAIDEDYLATLGLTLVAGRGFELNRPADIEDGLVINETAVQELGWQNPEDAIGKKIDSPSKHPAGTVIGVVKDYHEFGLQEKIYPMAMDYNPARSRYYAIRFKTTGTADLLKNLETLWKKNYDRYDFRYFFLDENFARQYQTEQRLANLFTAFSVITIIIAMIGLTGLVSFMVVSRTKEIGIRKVLGAGAFNITGLLSKEFMVLVIVANVVACPVAWYFANSWLEKFAYRMDLNPGIFVLTAGIGLVVTMLTVSFHTVRAAKADPVKSLRYE